MLSVFSAPSRYTQGKHATRELGNELRTLGITGPLLILASASAQRLLAADWEASLGATGFAYSVRLFGGECSLAEIERGKLQAREMGARAIAGAGGGKVLDAARAIAADLGLPVINCPTVASSDAPCSALSVIYTEDGAFDQYRIYGRNPDLVLVDTWAIAQAPPRLLAAGMGDALATWFEAKICVEGHRKNMRGGASTRSGLALAELCYRTLLEDGVDAMRANRERVVTPSLERLVEANTLLSGLGFESSGLAAAHAVHNGLTAVTETHSYFHGEKVAFGVLVQLVLEGHGKERFVEVLHFATSVGLPVTLAGVGIMDPRAGAVDAIAARSTAPGETIHNEPFPVTPDLVADAILAADAVGRDWLANR